MDIFYFQDLELSRYFLDHCLVLAVPRNSGIVLDHLSWQTNIFDKVSSLGQFPPLRGLELLFEEVPLSLAIT